MRTGFIRSLLFSRYGDLWLKLAQEVGLEPVVAQPEAVYSHLSGGRLSKIPGLSFQLAGAEALALVDTDLIIAPDLNPGPDVPRGGGQDPWIAAFPETLATSLGGLPRLIGVPALVSEPGEVEGLTTEVLLPLIRDPARLRRAWERHTGTAAPKKPKVRWQRVPGEEVTVGLIGQPWLMKPALTALLEQEEIHLIPQAGLEPQVLRQEGWRAEPRLVPTDAEVMGAARTFARRGGVDRLLFLADENSGADAWLHKQVKSLSHKPVELVKLQDVLTPANFDILLS